LPFLSHGWFIGQLDSFRHELHLACIRHDYSQPLA
jgi:hypothetical protein